MSEPETTAGSGRELDVTVLVDVFGFPRKKVFHGYPSDFNPEEPYYIPSGKSRRTHMIDAWPVPRYSTDIAAAWEVVEHFQEQNHHFELRVGFDWDGNAVGYIARAANGPGVNAETAPLAICRAALATIEEDAARAKRRACLSQTHPAREATP